MLTVLPPDELKRRLDAFRTLKGMRQIDLAALLEADGFGKQDVGRLERGDLPLTRARRRSLAEHLGVPERWLVDEELDLADYTGEQEPEPSVGDQISALSDAIRERSRHDDKVDRLLEQQNQLLARQSQILERIEHLMLSVSPDAPAEEPDIPRFDLQPGEDRQREPGA